MISGDLEARGQKRNSLGGVRQGGPGCSQVGLELKDTGTILRLRPRDTGFGTLPLTFFLSQGSERSSANSQAMIGSLYPEVSKERKCSVPKY